MIFEDTQELPVGRFQPGNWNQDIYTIPIESALLGIMNATYSKSTRPLWPFRSESTTAKRNPTRHPLSVVMPTIIGVSAGTFGVIHYYKPHLDYWIMFRGFIHAHLVTEIVTSWAKLSFQRERPFYDTVSAKGIQRDDDRKSFFSGHSSHAFAFATYSSLLVFKAFNASPGTSFYALAAFGSAGFVALTRARDKQHHMSDVVVGSLFGSLSSYFVFDSLTHTSIMLADEKPDKTNFRFQLYPSHTLSQSNSRYNVYHRKNSASNPKQKRVGTLHIPETTLNFELNF